MWFSGWRDQGYLTNLCYIYVLPFFLVTNLLIDGPRWQMYPFYVQLGFSMIRASVTTSDATTTMASISATSGWVSPLLKLLATTVASLMCAIVPIPVLPPPEGSWGCGIEEFRFVVSPWHRFAGSTPFGQRGLPLSSYDRNFQCLVYYPIEDHQHQRESRYLWLPRDAFRALATVLGLPKFLFTYLHRVETHSTMFAPLSRKRKKYPIVFFSHGLLLLPTLHSVLCEGLASQGYIVVAVHHTDGSALTTPPTLSGVPQPFYGYIHLRTLSLKLPRDLRKTIQVARQHNTTSDEASVGSGGTSNWIITNQTPPSSGRDAHRQLRHDTEALTELIGQTTGANLSASYTRAAYDDNASPRSTQDLDIRHTQLLIRASELRAAYDGVIQLSETSGSWVKDRIDWDASAIMGFGFGCASALLSALSYGRRQDLKQPFNSCVLLCPWLDALKELELSEGYALQTEENSTGGSTESPAAGGKILPKNFLVVTTQQQNSRKPSNLIRLIKRIRECSGDRTIIQFNRCRNLDLTDIPLVSPSVFRWLRLSGPRDPAKSQLMATRAVFNFLNHQYRRSLFTVPHRTSRHCQRKISNTFKQQATTTTHGASAGSESDALAAFSVGSVSDASTATISRSRKKKGAIEALKQRYSPSTMQALRLIGITEHYIRGLGGLNTATVSRELSRIPSNSGPQPATLVFDVMDGVMQYVDDVDRKKQKLLEEREGFADCCVSEVCHI